jgi:hypothetical protein
LPLQKLEEFGTILPGVWDFSPPVRGGIADFGGYWEAVFCWGGKENDLEVDKTRIGYRLNNFDQL